MDGKFSKLKEQISKIETIREAINKGNF